MSAWKVSIGGKESVDVASADDAIRLGQYIYYLNEEIKRHQRLNAIVYEECAKFMFIGGRFEVSKNTVDMLAEAYPYINTELKGGGL